jgi:hypothetical protein
LRLSLLFTFFNRKLRDAIRPLIGLLMEGSTRTWLADCRYASMFHAVRIGAVVCSEAFHRLSLYCFAATPHERLNLS